jgi:hypothetical protein
MKNIDQSGNSGYSDAGMNTKKNQGKKRVSQGGQHRPAEEEAEA